MARTLRYLLPLLLLATALPALAQSAYEDGRALYKSGNYAQAAAKLEQATRETPSDARAWWQLNFAYHKLNRDPDALKAVQKAGELDPKHGFASEPGKYEEILSDRQSAAGQTTTGAGKTGTAGQITQSAGVSTREGSGRGSITQQLVNGDVYVEPGMNVDLGKLRATAVSLRPTVVKFVVFNSNSNSATLDREADRILTTLKAYINRGEGYVIIGSRRAVTVASQSLSKATKKDLIDQVAPQIAGGSYTDGLCNLAKGLVQTKSAHSPAVTTAPGGVPHPTSTGPNWGLIIVGIIAVVVVLWLISRVIGNKKAMAARREPLERQRGEVIAQLNMLDDNLNMLDAATASRVREMRVRAGTKLDEASRIINHAKSDRDLGRAQSLLDQASGDIASGRALIDRAISGAPAPAPAASPSFDAQPAAPTSLGTDWNNVPQDEKGVCFFCSKPSLLRDLTPVTVNLNGQQQKVLACQNDLGTIKSGAMPQIRAFQQNGQYVPWYAYQGYDPYRDYYRYTAGDFMADMVMLSMIDHMYWGWHHPMGWGWGGGYGYGGNTYVFYPEHDSYRDYYSGQAAGYSDFNRQPDTTAGADFLSSTGGDASYGGDLGRDRS